ncbi:MAG: pseudouridine-5-phosphate glycosidase [Tenericutes bacterium 4572_104]|nr:MAG: pseudouridine-5-phosphate glycosidase [Tenericutes bacterium 4572_104]
MIRIRKDIKEAIKNKKAVVALESTIISHGMPYPENVKTALHCQEIIESNGALAATIAIINGDIVVGLTEEEIEYIANEKVEVLKVGRKDLPVVLTRKQSGALTVSATMLICDMVGIKFFATGGIGGVHRGASETFDISSDLEEFTKSKVAVISAGAKAILDLEKTMEYLETKGVLVLGYNTFDLPAFYTRTSGIPLEYNAKSPKEIADICKTKWNLSLEGGVFIANPIPEEYSYPEEKINKAIDKAIEDMNNLGIKGKQTTPYLLKRIVEITDNKSLEVNMELVYNNCDLAAKIAKEYWKK